MVEGDFQDACPVSNTSPIFSGNTPSRGTNMVTCYLSAFSHTWHPSNGIWTVRVFAIKNVIKAIQFSRCTVFRTTAGLIWIELKRWSKTSFHCVLSMTPLFVSLPATALPYAYTCVPAPSSFAISLRTFSNEKTKEELKGPKQFSKLTNPLTHPASPCEIKNAKTTRLLSPRGLC